MIQAIDLISRDGKILWDCGLNVPPGEEGKIIFDKKKTWNQEEVCFLFVQVRSCRKCPTFQTRRTFELIGFGTLAGRRETLSLSCKIVRLSDLILCSGFNFHPEIIMPDIPTETSLQSAKICSSVSAGLCYRKTSSWRTWPKDQTNLP